ncbi:MAG: Na(+)-translocating NADH-quinone reductase subunit A, partial [Bacteroidota bacterium]|nr:Na(+)-translocating NADH-quinone reductase subunit A [Bacteroidota bacterium]
MSKVIKIKKGKNIHLQGPAERIAIKAKPAETYAVKPSDFVGIRPKLLIEKGDKVKAGSPLFYDKYQADVMFTSPVSGEIININRGDRRKLLEIVIKADKQQEFIEFTKSNPKDLDKNQIIVNLQQSGLWPSIKQRPYNVIANAKDTPKAIFISAFDTAPLAADVDFLVKDDKNNFQTGIDALSKLTNGTIHININNDYPAAETLTKAKGVQINRFTGPHPAGNVGIQINKINPINKGETIWTISPQKVISIGRLFNKGQYDASKIIALAGSEIKNPKYYKIIDGANISNLLEDNLLSNNNRYISGNVLTGTKISKNGFVSYYDSLISVIPEGNYYDFLGWALPGLKKYSF